MRGYSSHVSVESRSDLYRRRGRRVGPEKGGYRTSGRERSLLRIRPCISYVQEQRLKDFSLQQRAEMIGSKVGVVSAEQSRCHAGGQE